MKCVQRQLLGADFTSGQPLKRGGQSGSEIKSPCPISKCLHVPRLPTDFADENWSSGIQNFLFVLVRNTSSSAAIATRWVGCQSEKIMRAFYCNAVIIPDRSCWRKQIRSPEAEFFYIAPETQNSNIYIYTLSGGYRGGIPLSLLYL